MNRDKLLIVAALLVVGYTVTLALGAIWIGASTLGSAIPETSPANALCILGDAGVLREVLGGTEDGGGLVSKGER
jgi:hypothetical protein